MISVKITDRKVEALDIISLTLASYSDMPLPLFTAGAHVDVEVKPGLIRQYSLCPNSGNANDVGQYKIAVLKDATSRGGSIALHTVEVGQTLRISAPRNLFPLAPDARRSILFAGGIGITPILAMADALSKHNANFTLHYCARSPEHMAFRTRLKEGSFADRICFHYDDGPQDQKLDVEATIAAEGPDAHIYVCGPSGFIDLVVKTASAHGLPSAHIHREYFAADPASTAAGSGAFQIKIASSGQLLTVPEGKTALDILRSSGIDVVSSCELGVCGACITGVLEGVPDHRDMCLMASEREANTSFTPCCSRAHSTMLLLDL